MDIQFVVDAYACVVYIVSYISKAEREMGLLLGNAHKEASKGDNLSAKEALKKLGTVYLHHRDVCAQEAVYRLTNMHLKQCSRAVVFIPIGKNTVKMSLPLSVLKQRASSAPSHDLRAEDMWMTSITDRYKNRPSGGEFDDMCLAKFASEYRVVTKKENCKTPIELKSNMGSVTKRKRTQAAVVRYVRFSETKNPELFYESILQLFLPHRADAQLKPQDWVTFKEFYTRGRVTFSDGSAHSVQSVVDLNRAAFEVDADKLEEAQDQADDGGLLEDAWCELCPEAELERLECIQEGRQIVADVGEHEGNVPDLAVSRHQVSCLEKRNNVMTRSEGLTLIRSLNETQMSIFYSVRQWCLDRVAGKKPEPLHVFITGGAGTGKSHLIKAIQYEATRLLSRVSHHPDSACVLLTAPTGIAAYNLNASTIHHTFSIGINVRLPYTPLGEEKLNSLRAQLRDVQIVIIDEISMVDHNLLAYVHGRLRQIKQTGDFSPFGNVCVLAVGDFYQLPPVKGKPLYNDDVAANLWSSFFKVVELTTVVRQKDSAFADLLNRLRTRTKKTPMLNSDIDVLKSRETGEVSSALHIFPTNSQVNEHNVEQLFTACPEHKTIAAQDFVNSKRSGNLERMSGHHRNASNTCLEASLQLGVGARVMLIKNVDISDGLVNGVCGTVTDIAYRTSECKFPQVVYVKFDNDKVGTQSRKNSPRTPLVVAGSTGVEPVEERATKKGGMRRQFPLKLAWACTAHKTQGITVDEAVVSLEKIFAPGQAYVALSRVRYLSGLTIMDFSKEAIYCNPKIKQALESMPRFSVEYIGRPDMESNTFSVFLMNVQGLSGHAADLASCTQHLQLNCIAVTETWLSANSSLEEVQISGYSFCSRPRSLSYDSSHPALLELQRQQHGGAGLYCRDGVVWDVIEAPNVNLECLVCACDSYDVVLVVIYRPPSYPLTLFKHNLRKLLNWLNWFDKTVAVMGDFNNDILTSSSVCGCMAEEGFVQVVTQPTTESGTLIDHVYIKSAIYDVQSVVLPTYFSDHEGIVCSFNLSNVMDE
ncbi:hypothetical protein PAMA_015902 [Pampus argenteus]